MEQVRGAGRMSRKVVVVWSDSASARYALRWAVTWWGADQIHMLHVSDWEESSADIYLGDSLVERARARLEDDVVRARTQYPGVAFSATYEQATPLSALIAHTSAGQVLVFGTGPAKLRKTHYAWTIQTRVAAIAHGPVVLVPLGTDDNSQLQPPRPGEIVVGIDGSLGEEALISVAAEEAKRTQSRLRLVHAWSVPSMWQAEESLDDGVLIKLEMQHRALLESSVRSVGLRHPEIEVEGTLSQDDPSEAIIAASTEAAMVVVGRHRLERYERMFLGSVSHSVLLSVSAPTLVLPLAESN